MRRQLSSLQQASATSSQPSHSEQLSPSSSSLAGSSVEQQLSASIASEQEGQLERAKAKLQLQTAKLQALREEYEAQKMCLKEAAGVYSQGFSCCANREPAAL